MVPASMCRPMLFAARSLKEKHFLWSWYRVKKKNKKKKHKYVKIEFGLSCAVICIQVDNEYASLLFSQTSFFRIVSTYWASVLKFFKGKSDEYK